MREENLQAHGEYRVAKRIAQLQTCLSPHDNDEYLTQINENYCPDTGQWIFKDQRFQTWAEGSSDEPHGRLLWLTGIPGAGIITCYPSTYKTGNC
jgi:hypothetical protein